MLSRICQTHAGTPGSCAVDGEKALSKHQRSVFGLAVAPATAANVAERILTEAPPPGSGPRLLVTANLDHVVTLARDAAFRDAYANAWLITADGMPVYLYARARGLNVPERVTGADLCPVLLDRLAPGTSRLFIMPSSAATAARIEEALLARGFAPEALRFVVPPFGFEDDPAAAAALAGDVATHRTTHLFLGLGAPKSEIWANRHRGMLGDCYVLAFGAGLDFYAGTKPRAPSALRRIGLEWVWRLASEPRRLARRYLVRSWWFLWLVLADIAGSPPPAGGDGAR